MQQRRPPNSDARRAKSRKSIREFKEVSSVMGMRDTADMTMRAWKRGLLLSR